jgi:hypothetical protein
MSGRIFLLSPAHLGGKRADLLLGGRGRFALAERLGAGGTATLGEAFSFLSGLYFRGKLAYARRFARAPAGAEGVYVITSNRGLVPAEAPMTAADLRALAGTEIRADDPEYREPLHRTLASIDPEPSVTEIVLLGSIATGKYVDVLLDRLGGRLLFPGDFVGRGDMSRGALLLRAAREGRELEYRPVGAARRRGPRPPPSSPRHASRKPHSRRPAHSAGR